MTDSNVIITAPSTGNDSNEAPFLSDQLLSAIDAQQKVESIMAEASVSEMLPSKNGRFLIPAEEADDLPDEMDMDTGTNATHRVRRPGRTEFVKVAPWLAFTTNVLSYKPSPEAMEEQTYYVIPALRGHVAAEMRSAKFIPAYGVSAKRVFLWMIKHSDTC